MAALAVFLLSDEAATITGAIHTDRRRLRRRMIAHEDLHDLMRRAAACAAFSRDSAAARADRVDSRVGGHRAVREQQTAVALPRRGASGDHRGAWRRRCAPRSTASRWRSTPEFEAVVPRLRRLLHAIRARAARDRADLPAADDPLEPDRVAARRGRPRPHRTRWSATRG